MLVLGARTDSVLFLLFSLVTIATALYLPQHILFIWTRAWFYLNGECPDAANQAVDALTTGAKEAAAQAAATMAKEL